MLVGMRTCLSFVKMTSDAENYFKQNKSSK